jgi:hypothetical protein
LFEGIRVGLFEVPGFALIFEALWIEYRGRVKGIHSGFAKNNRVFKEIPNPTDFLRGFSE